MIEGDTPPDPSAVPLPETDNPPLLRTDFTDDEAWSALRAEVGDGCVTFVADPVHRGLPARQLYFSDFRDSVDDAGVYRLSPKYHQALAELRSVNQAPTTIAIPGPRQ